MNRKIAETKLNVKDATKLKKAEAASRPLIITNRTIMGHDIANTPAASTEMQEEQTASPPAPPSKRTVIVPVTSKESQEPEKQKQPKLDDEPSQADVPVGSPLPEESPPLAATPKPKNRDTEVKRYIDSHKYFVPINTVAHRRSIMASMGLTIIVFLLSIVLIDLMLDSGVILLIQKIPHTHFFDLSN